MKHPLIERLTLPNDEDRTAEVQSVAVAVNGAIKSVVAKHCGPDQQYVITFGVGEENCITQTNMEPEEVVALFRACADAIEKGLPNLTADRNKRLN